MEFVERVDYRSVQWLMSQLSNDFIAKYTNINEGNGYKYSLISQVLKEFNKNDGVRKAVYHKGSTDTHKLLLDYATGIQSLPRKIRGLLCKQMTDFDTINCHPSIFLNICKLRNILCPCLEKYVAERDKMIEDGVLTKPMVLKQFNKKQRVNPKNCSPFMNSFDLEIKQIQQALIVLPEFAIQKEMATLHKPTNIEGSFMSYVAATYQEQMILNMIDFFKTKNIEIAVLMFDGIMIYGNHSRDLLGEMSQMIKEKMNFDLKYEFKKHDDSIVVPADWLPANENQIYLDMKRKFETDYNLAFVRYNSSYAYKIGHEIQLLTHTDIKAQFRNEFYAPNKGFFLRWDHDEEKKIYDNVGLYPHDMICPDGVLNLWKGYAVERLPAVENFDLTLILNHIRILTATDQLSNWLLDWLANMLQFPSSQSVLIILQGLEGSGKSVICDFMGHIMGRETYYECLDIKENLFGRFNGHLAGKIFININETDRHEMMPYVEKIKGMITSPINTIEEKGQKKYVEDNKRHFIMTLNPENPLVMKEGQRRYSYIECSDELVGNTEYFNELVKFIQFKPAQRAFYQYLMARPVKRKFTIVDIPITDAMKKVYALNRDPIEDYCIEFVGEKDNLYLDYKQWLVSSGLKYEISKKQFEAKFTKFADKHKIVKVVCDETNEDGVRIRRKYVKQLAISE
jgi:hypothetical protein